MKVDIIFYDRKTQKETGKKEFGLLSAFFYARYEVGDTSKSPTPLTKVLT